MALPGIFMEFKHLNLARVTMESRLQPGTTVNGFESLSTPTQCVISLPCATLSPFVMYIILMWDPTGPSTERTVTLQPKTGRARR